MNEDFLLKLLRQVKSDKISIEDAQNALEGVSLSEDQYESAIDHGVFNEPSPGTIVRASIRPSGESFLMVIVGLWGVLWTLFWAGSLSYGLFNHWDQQLLSFFLGMTLLTVIILGIVYIRFVMPDLIIVKHRRNKFIQPNDPDGWQQYEV